MSKILITPLGTGPIDRKNSINNRRYRKADYKIDNKLYKNKTFVSDVLIKHFDVDKVFFVGTSKSMWEKIYEKYVTDTPYYEEQELIEIDDKIKLSTYDKHYLDERDLVSINKGLDYALDKQGSKCFIIKYGINEEELLSNIKKFSIISSHLASGDELFLDITHSFRSLSLLQYMMVNYFENLLSKKLTIKGVFYGMLDVCNELGYAPIVDLKITYQISEWIKAISEFQNYGNGYLLADLLQDNNIKAANKLRHISDLIGMSAIRECPKVLKDIEAIEIEDFGIDVSKFINEYLKYFSPSQKGSKFLISISKWFFKHHQYTKGYIILSESIVTFVGELLAKKNTKENNGKLKYIIENKYNNNSNAAKELRRYYINIKNIRNMVAHMSPNIKSSNIKSYIDQGLYNIKKVEKLFESITEDDFYL